MDYTKEFIQEKLTSDPRWIERALIVMLNRQTEDERTDGKTKHFNGMGYSGVDSRYLTYCSKWVRSGKHLNEKHLEKCGMKLKKYWKQILEEIQFKEGQK